MRSEIYLIGLFSKQLLLLLGIDLNNRKCSKIYPFLKEATRPRAVDESHSLHFLYTFPVRHFCPMFIDVFEKISHGRLIYSRLRRKDVTVLVEKKSLFKNYKNLYYIFINILFYHCIVQKEVG